MQRFTTGGEPGAAHPLPGVVAELQAHVALLPMLRLGPYLSHDISPLTHGPARQITEAGMMARLAPPILRLPWRTWAFAGVGYARTYEPSHVAEGEFVPGQGGGLLDTRLGVGLGYKLDRTWEVFAELGGRFGVFFTGSMYDPGACGCAEPFVGKDLFALSLSLGLSLNQ
jgi:hypothetical protein